SRRSPPALASCGSSFAGSGGPCSCAPRRQAPSSPCHSSSTPATGSRGRGSSPRLPAATGRGRRCRSRSSSARQSGSPSASDVAGGLAGFYRSWATYIGLELGLFERLREAGDDGLTVEDLALGAECVAEPVSAWVRAAHAADLIELHGERCRLDPDLATVLLD